MKSDFTGDKHSPITMFNHQQPPPITTISSSEVDNTIPNDGGSIELIRKPRGRPPGSKNKRKPPVFITREPESNTNMYPYVLEVASGSDIVGVVTKFCNKNNTGICVLSGSGSVANVSFRQPTTTTPVTFRGVVELLSISATVLPSSSQPPAMLKDFVTKFTITIAGPKGQTFGGVIVGPLIAAGTVYIVATSFNNPLYHRLPLEEDDDHVKNYGDGCVSIARQQSISSGGGDGGRHYTPLSTTTESLPAYSSHLPTDVIWAPIPRQAPPHTSFY